LLAPASPLYTFWVLFYPGDGFAWSVPDFRLHQFYCGLAFLKHPRGLLTTEKEMKLKRYNQT
jgi:hypothetical protein